MRLSFTGRRVFAAIAIAAFLISPIWAGIVLLRRSLNYRSRAAQHERKINDYSHELAVRITPKFSVTWIGPDRWGEEEHRLYRFTLYHTKLRKKYESAALHPWIAVEPDPPEPE